MVNDGVAMGLRQGRNFLSRFELWNLRRLMAIFSNAI